MPVPLCLRASTVTEHWEKSGTPGSDAGTLLFLPSEADPEANLSLRVRVLQGESAYSYTFVHVCVDQCICGWMLCMYVIFSLTSIHI